MQLNVLKTKKARYACVLLLSIAMTLTWLETTDESLKTHRALKDGGDANLRSPVNADRSLNLNKLDEELGLKEGSSFSDFGTLVALITTPKTGTSTLTRTFKKSWKCDEREGKTKWTEEFSCQKKRYIVRSHLFDDAVEAIAQQRKEKSSRQCLILSTIRSPRPWFASMYFQSKGCPAIKRMTNKELIRDFRKFIGSDFSKQFSDFGLQNLLEQFQGGSLSDQVEVMNQNGGYSVLSAASPDSVFGGCKLLFLDLEQADGWPTILEKVAPGVDYQIFPSRKDLCPGLHSKYEWIQNYEITDEDMTAIKGQHPIIAEWFQAYGYMKE